MILNTSIIITGRLFKRVWRRFLPVLSASLLLAACAVTPTLETWQPPSATDISDWQFSGRVSLTRAEEGWHAGLFWQEHAGQYQLKLTGPLGQGVLRLSGNADGVTLERANAETLVARDAEGLLLRATGWSLPVSGLRYWVRGLPVPGIKASEQRDIQGRLQTLEQSGWSIRYTRYHFVAGVGWPAKLQLVHGDVSVRLVINEWQPGVIAGSGM